MFHCTRTHKSSISLTEYSASRIVILMGGWLLHSLASCCRCTQSLPKNYFFHVQCRSATKSREREKKKMLKRNSIKRLASWKVRYYKCYMFSQPSSHDPLLNNSGAIQQYSLIEPIQCGSCHIVGVGGTQRCVWVVNLFFTHTTLNT